MAEIAAAIGAKVVPPTAADVSTIAASVDTGAARQPLRFVAPVRTDSREVEPGDTFVARRGATTDGHRYAAKAVDRGAALLIGERETDHRVPQLLVDDSTRALGELARAVVRRAQAAGRLRTVGITGSNGKTTTKNLVAAMAQRLGPTVSSWRSYNNEVGGPLTMLQLSTETETLVAEMGASAEGEIARLAEMAEPDIGVVLSVGLAHVGEFGDITATFRTKSELVRQLPESAVAVLNRDDPWVAQMAALTRARILWFGQHPEAQVRASEIVSDASGTSFLLHTGGTTFPVHFPVLGEHHVSNALAAAAVALELGLAPTEIVASLAGTTLAAHGRMQVTRARNGIVVINDAYNASPESMRAALATLARVKQPAGRTVAVLGAMSELGDQAGAEHDRVALQAVRLNIDQLIVVGADARRLHLTAVNEGSWNGESVFFAERDAALRYLIDTVRGRDTVLVKASNAQGLYDVGSELAAALTSDSAQETSA